MLMANSVSTYNQRLSKRQRISMQKYDTYSKDKIISVIGMTGYRKVRYRCGIIGKSAIICWPSKIERRLSAVAACGNVGS